MKQALTYDDIQLIPQYSEIESRSNIDLTTKLTRNFEINLPIITSPMDTVCELEMAKKLYDLGAVGCIHRFMSEHDQCMMVQSLDEYVTSNWGGPVMAAIGIKSKDRDRAKSLVYNGANILLIDVAHGDHKNVIDMVKWLKDNIPDYVDVIAGNIATAEGAMRLEDAGADAIRANIGNGSLCTTRIKTGFGVPSVTAIENISNVVSIPVIADGGIRTSGDIVKAFACGADTVMLGSLLAGTEESPGTIIEKAGGQLYKKYRGSASRETKISNNQEERHIEGESTLIPFKGGVKYIIKDLEEGIRSGLSYAGCADIPTFQAKASYNIVTNAGIIEAKPHLL